ncbi:leucine rich adaptor protein 1 [Hippoglossus stenolepis]|uniref:leucine rich adaptor protein 1 n=1 Tax=Hippoglossus stenolepis TaxID=195615 RepID=UPI001FAFCF40|nr:leucine rich adaptor protein 1 [Hippoglossus stenolepis]
MAEESLRDFFPEMREVENKVGRKTPESLLMWMRDAADCGDGCRCDVGDRGDHSSASSGSFSDRISCLKQEMRRLRSADVRILRQLLAVHEGIEAMRWLMEERGSLVSGGGSLTGSLSSLVTVEEHGPSVTPCRESQSPTFPQDLTETTGEDSAGQRSPHDDGDSFHKSYLDVLSPESGGGRSPSPSNSEFEPNPANGLVSASLQKSQTQDVDAGQDPTAGACTISRALLRSRKARKEVKADISGFTQESGEIQTERSPPQESFRASPNEVMEEQESASTAETVLLGYDAQWCWVESQDDVTFL